jgi:hypothetical protein
VVIRKSSAVEPPPDFFGMSGGEGNIPCRRIAVCPGPAADTFSFC